MSSPRIPTPTQSQLEEPRFHLGQRMLITGVKGRFTGPDVAEFSALWQRFAVHLGKIAGQVALITYGICYNIIPSPFSFEYMAGVGISVASAVLADFGLIRLPEMRYVIFTHRGHVSTLSKTIDTIHQNCCQTRASSWFKEFPMLRCFSSDTMSASTLAREPARLSCGFPSRSGSNIIL